MKIIKTLLNLLDSRSACIIKHIRTVFNLLPNILPIAFVVCREAYANFFPLGPAVTIETSLHPFVLVNSLFIH